MTVITTAVQTTRSGRPKVPPLETARITLEVARDVEKQLAKAGDDDRERLAVLSNLMGKADNTVKMPGGEKHMYRLAVSLHVYEGARGVWRGIGVARETFSRRHVAVALKADEWENSPPAWDPERTPARAREMKVPFYKNAIHELPELAETIYRARATQRYIRPLRNDLLLKLRAQGMTNVELADIIGRNPSRISHIVVGKGR